jgi:HAD superfamily hydrolase (TIGR01509 family)
MMSDRPDVLDTPGLRAAADALDPDGLPEAVLWDMDGTIVDTEPCWHEAEFALVDEFGGTWTRADALALIGTSIPAAGLILQAAGVRLPADEIVQRLLDHVVGRVQAGDVPWMPGARELLTALRAAGVPTALVTMSFTVLADAVVELLPRDSFDVIVTGDTVQEAKPHPEPYLIAAAELGVDPRHAVAIEDSAPGIASAQSAGVPVIAVSHVTTVVPDPRRIVLDSLDGVTPGDLARMAREIRLRSGALPPVR